MSQAADVFFMSHGGPPHMFAYDSPAHDAWKRIGRELAAARPEGIIAISAHWENEEAQTGDVLVNANGTNPLIYDFYGFPDIYYKQTFHSSGSEKLISLIRETFNGSGVKVTERDRGLDHGIWVPFTVAFERKCGIPLVQVSLPGDGTFSSAIRLGEVLGKLRHHNIAIVCSGQIVHNLRDFRSNNPLPYLEPFMKSTSTAINSPDPKSAVGALKSDPHFKGAHPTDEHFLPLCTAVGATTGSDRLEEIYLGKENNLGWGFWKWARG